MHWLLTLCVITLKFLAISSFNVCFVSEVQRDCTRSLEPMLKLGLAVHASQHLQDWFSATSHTPPGDTATLCSVFSQEGPGQRGKEGSGMHTCLDKPGSGPQVSVSLKECDIK